MYLGLFLAPWMLIYGLSTMAMNHREWFKNYYGGQQGPVWEKESERQISADFSADADSSTIAARILSDLSLAGRFYVRGKLSDESMLIQRDDPVTPRRITYTPATGTVVVEKQAFRTNQFLERMHRRRGYGSGVGLEDTWAFSVDLVIAAMVFWAASGLWMWWELKVTRALGALFAGVGVLLFGFFLMTI
jgi:hypothetical protein